MVKDIKLTGLFKKQAAKAILSIILFVVVYILMVLFAIGLTIVCAYAGIKIIILMPKLVTIILGVGLASLGIIVLIFLLKFIFKSHISDLSNLVEIKEGQEPELFRMIREVANEVGTRFPKKVYLSGDVNAGVFYNHSFWSMFFPIRKNLQIGLGLVNSVSPAEFKAILAHEFGHFSQKTMTIGSYIYNVNQIIYSMLYDNESYGDSMRVWAEVSGFIAIFVAIAAKIIEAIQWISEKMYKLINICYMSLSREMEFHADEIAAHVAGSDPLISALLRLDLAKNSLDTVFHYYEKNIPKNLRSKNVYKEQSFVMNFSASEFSIPVKDNLPQIPMEFLKRFNKSKLVIKDQWASHPSVEDRVARLQKLNISPKATTASGNLLLTFEYTQQQFTEKIFEKVHYAGKVETNPFENFKSEFEKEQAEQSFDKIYNGYYNKKNPEWIDINNLSKGESTTIRFEDLYSQEKVDLIYTVFALQKDIQILRQISLGLVNIKSFDYDGKKYKRYDCDDLQKQLEQEITATNEEIKSNDLQIILYFRKIENSEESDSKLLKLYKEFYSYDKEYDNYFETYSQFTKEFETIRSETAPEYLGNSFSRMKIAEEGLKDIIRKLLEDERFQNEITGTMKENFKEYLAQDLAFSHYQGIFTSKLDILIDAMNDFYGLISKKYLIHKKELLDYQANLMKKQ